MSSDHLTNWQAHAKCLGVGSANTAIAYAKLSVDPLPVVMERGVPRTLTLHVEQWRARRNGGLMRDGTTLERCDCVSRIADRLGCSASTVLRLSRLTRDPLPLYGQTRARWTYETAIRDWLARRTIPFQAMRPSVRASVGAKAHAARQNKPKR